ncbi:Crp/Fnr family transcriptional regulator [Aestuariibaculum suncheonense]|uniref:Crp/Fnr family transcriptional regulator n=1 Tax=Aestuariibaculum suncheonense TaxID=1028745 RepID=A0A8J6UAD5_9FLAO|nr:Crp/Fnr family transcriptional regulator [Aestuariibaculum suncheonense]MBD0835138.1 Crp/Fnr family transcriptional regulator [Aestuariibaculum suncheonense]
MAKENKDYIIPILKENPLFKEISEEEIHTFLKISSVKKWPKNTCLFDGDSTLYNFYIIIAGKLKLYYYNKSKDRKITLFLLVKHDVFDVSRLLNFSRHKVYYETLSNADILTTNSLLLERWMLDNPKFYKSLLHYTLAKLKDLEEYATSASIDDTSTKLARLLINNMNTSSKQIEKINDLPHKELAQLIGTTRAVLNRQIQIFKKEGIIDIKNKNIEIKNMSLLLDKLNNS